MKDRRSKYENMKTKRMKKLKKNVKGRKGPILSEIQHKPRDFSGTTVKSIFYNVTMSMCRIRFNFINTIYENAK